MYNVTKDLFPNKWCSESWQNMYRSFHRSIKQPNGLLHFTMISEKIMRLKTGVITAGNVIYIYIEREREREKSYFKMEKFCI